MMKPNKISIFIFIFLTLNGYSADAHQPELTLWQVKVGSALHKDFLQTLINIFGVDVFVESGTYIGDSTAIAATCFKEVHTIELGQQLYQAAKERFRNQANVHLYLGDSSKVLDKILKTLKGNILFWLDGHYSGGNTALGDSNTPILQELAAIKNCGITDSIILIDDMRLFRNFKNNSDSNINGYPTIEDLQHALFTINPQYQILIMGDIALAYPHKFFIALSPVLQACTQSRCSDKFTFDQILVADKTIGSASGSERTAIVDLVQRFPNANGYYHLLYGLVCEQEKSYQEAYNHYITALNNEFNNWRAWLYAARVAHKVNNKQLMELTLQEAIKQQTNVTKEKLWLAITEEK